MWDYMLFLDNNLCQLDFNLEGHKSNKVKTTIIKKMRCIMYDCNRWRWSVWGQFLLMKQPSVEKKEVKVIDKRDTSVGNICVRV